jgi:hypothetical protein
MLINILLKNFIIKSNIFWVITPCSPLKVNRRFGGTYRLYFEDRRISRTLESKVRDKTAVFGGGIPGKWYFEG